MSVESGQHDSVWDLHLKNYSYKEIWLTIDQIVDSCHPLRDMNPSHCSSLVKFVRVYHFD